MNFGWDLTQPGEIDTAIHEIGHTLGFPHEHQNPHAGIVWDEEAVYAALAQPPNQLGPRQDAPQHHPQDRRRTRCRGPTGTPTRSCTTRSRRA